MFILEQKVFILVKNLDSVLAVYILHLFVVCDMRTLHLCKDSMYANSPAYNMLHRQYSNTYVYSDIAKHFYPQCKLKFLKTEKSQNNHCEYFTLNT